MNSIIYNLFIIYFISLFFGPIVYFGNFPVSVYQVLFLFLFLFLFLNKVYKKEHFHIFKYMKIFFFLMIYFMFIYMFKLFDLNYIHSLRDFIIIYSNLQYIVLSIIILEVFKYKDISKKLIKINIYILPIMGIIAILQIFHLFDIQDILVSYFSKIGVEESLEYLYWNPRSTATFNLEPNTFGLYMSFSLLMFHMFNENFKINKFISIYIYLFGIIGLLLSGSFTALGIYIITIFIYFIVYKKIGIKLIISFLIMLILLSTLFYENIEKSLERQHVTSDNLIPSSLIYRIEHKWVNVYNDFNKHPIVGIGPSAIQLDYAADNDFLDKFLRYGIMGGIVYLIFIVYLIIYPLFKRKFISDIFTRKLLLYSSLLALALAFASLTGTAFKAKRIAELFWIFYSIPFINLYLLKYRRK